MIRKQEIEFSGNQAREITYRGFDLPAGAARYRRRRLQKITFKAPGEKLSPLFDGTEQLISLSSVPWYMREIYLPGS